MADVNIDQDSLQELHDRIQTIKKAALELQELCGGIQAIYRNADRILASVNVLELDVTDVLEIL